MITLIIGGSGSGKSEFAEEYVSHLAGNAKEGRAMLYYLATMHADDEESRRRIGRHRQMRKGKGFETIEMPVRIERSLSMMENPENGKRKDVERFVLLECLSNLAANEMFDGWTDVRDGWHDPGAVKQRVLKGLFDLDEKSKHLVIVSNLIFDDGVEYDTVTTEYIRFLAELNIAVAKKAQTVIEVVMGLPNVLKGEMYPPCM